MITTSVQSNTDAPLSDCSIAFLLPRTLGLSLSAGASTSETEDQEFVANLLKTTVLKNFSQVLENAKMIGNSSFSSIPNMSPEEENGISAKRSRDCQMELQTKRLRQRRPGLAGAERGENNFNFSAKPAAVGVSQVGTSDMSRRSNCAESNSEADSQSWPVIDYSCLENITDPMEYFSTYRMLENAEKEVKRLKGEAAPRPNQPQSRSDRQRRPGLSNFEGAKHVFKFPSKIATMEASQMENSCQSNDLNIIELNIASCSREISQTENLRTVEPESKHDVNAKNHDSDADGIDELERLMSKCRELKNDELGIANFVRDALQIDPIHVEKSRGLSFSMATENRFEIPELRPVSSVSRETRVDELSALKGRLSVINPEGDPLFSPNYDGDKQSDDLEELGSSHKNFCDGRTKNLPSNKNVKFENPKSNFKDLRIDNISKSEETLNTKPLDAEEMTNQVDHLSVLKKTIPFIDIQSRLDKISILKRHILQSPIEDENLLFQYDDLEDSSLSKSQEVHPLSPVDFIHLDESSPVAQNVCIPLFSNGKQTSFEDEMHSPIDEILEAEKNNCKGNTSVSKGRQIPLFEKETCQRSDGIICDKNLVPDANLYEVGTDASEQPLYPEIPKDQYLSKDSILMDEHLEVPSDVLNGKNKIHGHSENSGGSRQRKLKRQEPTRRRIRKKSILGRKSLEGAGTEWKTGVRRSTRIRMKPLQYWCGERFLYGRVHDSLATVIGVKKFDTPQRGRTATMKVKSFVPEEYADLVAQVALY